MAYEKFDNSSKIKVYKQITPISCATTCAAMCVKKSPQTLKDDGFDLDLADWEGIAQKYGYRTFLDGIDSFSGIIDILRGGFPAVVKVNTGKNQHWVVVTKFEGDNSAAVSSNFTCADPWTGTVKRLDKALNYAGVYITKYLCLLSDIITFYCSIILNKM